MGVETEYGVSAPGTQVAPEVLSDLVVRAVAGPGADGFEDAGAGSPAGPGPDQTAANRALANGGRAYVDHAHPEYSSPETASPTACVAYDVAGDRLLADAARRVRERTGLPVRLYRNTTDGKGASYGRHENHLVSRQTPWQRVVDVMTGFLVARVPLVGAGRVGLGAYGERPGYQLSQRADFIVTPIGLQTTHDRPVLNTRDEPHADPRRWRRLHVITGDPAWCQVQTWLTVGSAAAVLAAVTDDAVAPLRWADPVVAQRAFSHDPTLRTTCETVDGRRLTALDGLEHHLAACEAHAVATGGSGGDAAAVLGEWRSVLDALRRDPAQAADRLDWAVKLRLLEGLRERTGTGWDDPRLAALDLWWADLERSPARALAARGALRTVVGDDEVTRATTEPPADTRAWLRGTLVTRFGDRVVAPGWEVVAVRRRGGRTEHVRMPEPLGHTRAACADAADAPDLDALLDRLAAR